MRARGLREVRVVCGYGQDVWGDSWDVEPLREGYKTRLVLEVVVVNGNKAASERQRAQIVAE